MTCPSWDDAIAVLPGECLALVNIERQVHVNSFRIVLLTMREFLLTQSQTAGSV